MRSHATKPHTQTHTHTLRDNRHTSKSVSNVACINTQYDDSLNTLALAHSPIRSAVFL